MSDRRKRAEEIFHEVVELEGEARARRLEELCGDDDALREEVVSLLRHLDAVDDGFLAGQPQLVTHRPMPESIGPYRVQELLGEGGMGSVYLAEQSAPLPRKVAVKVMAFGAHHTTLTQRFLDERRTLARLTHPNVAQVFDAGSTEQGVPYFAMEYVEGPTLPDHCDQQQLDLRQRIRLFLSVCAGVQHAHQRGVIHRDLKPSNILVATHEGQATPKVIDFGIAKEFGEEVESTPSLTVGPIGTPDYMSPEQMGGEAMIDTRSDVYSLGMILYELLTGTLPHDPMTLRKMSLPQRLRHRVESDAPTPSRRLSGNHKARDHAVARKTTPEGLRRALRNDLDWIVLRAIDPDPERRYASAQGLGVDLQRYLDHEPVAARPPDRMYLWRKAVRRNPVAWALAAGSFVLLLGFVSILLVQNRRISQERVRATQEAATAERVIDFLVDMFRQADPRMGKLETAEEILDAGKQRVTEFEDVPEVKSRLLLTMGIVHMEMGLLEEGEELLEEGLDLTLRIEGAESQASMARDALASLLRQKGEYTRAIELQRRALDQRLTIFGPSDARTLSSQSNLGVLLQIQGNYAEADSLFRAALEQWPAADTRQSQRALTMLHNIGVVALQQRRFAQAESLLTETSVHRAALLGPNHMESLETRAGLASCYMETGRHEEATALWEEVWAIEKQELGVEHPNTMRTANNLSSAYMDVGNLDRAETLLVETLRVAKSTQGRASQGTLAAMNNLGTLRMRQRLWSDAIELFDESVVRSREAFGENHLRVIRAQQNLAVAHRGAGNYDQAEALLAQVVSERSRQLGPRDPDTLRSTSSLGLLHERQGRWGDAVERHEAAYEGRREALGASHRSTLGSLHNLIRSLVKSEREAEALERATAGKENGLDLDRLFADPALAGVIDAAGWKDLRQP